jgi:hypothetical protein
VKLVTDWCEDTGLHLAQEKTEVILLTGKCVSKIFKFDLGGGEIHHEKFRKIFGTAFG